MVTCSRADATRLPARRRGHGCGADAVTALHVNYGLRERGRADERHCGELCQQARGGACEACGNAGSEPPGDGRRPGNLQAWARESATAPRERLARERDAVMRPDTRRATRSRRSSTGSRPPPGAAHCSGWRRPTDVFSGRSWRSLASRPPPTAGGGPCVAGGREQRRRPTRARASATARAGAACRAPGRGVERAAHGDAAARGDGAAGRPSRTSSRDAGDPPGAPGTAAAALWPA